MGFSIMTSTPSSISLQPMGAWVLGRTGYHGSIGARGQVLERRQDGTQPWVLAGLGSTFAVGVEHAGQLGVTRIDE